MSVSGKPTIRRRSASAPVRKATRGAPSWIVTFADLATLLLTFFILLLSYSKTDVAKYKAMAASMAGAFGSSTIQADAIGGSPLTLIESKTAPPPTTGQAGLSDEPRGPVLIDDQATPATATSTVPAGITELASRLIRELQGEVVQKALNVTYDTEKVTIRFDEDASFQSGQATLKPEMTGIIDRVVNVLASCSGDVLVAGYTDDKPIVSDRYRSNWDLSAARAVSVVHELVLNRKITPARVTAAGRAETHPLVPNDSPANRARNRRVEITIRQPECDAQAETGDLPVEIRP